MKSGSAGFTTPLTFSNQSSKPIRVFWITWEGTRKAWRGLMQPGDTQVCDLTYMTHVWLITDEKGKGKGL